MRYNVDGFGQKLRRARQDLGLTQPQVAEMMGVSYQTISQWETGYAHPRVKDAINLAEHFGFSIDIIYEEGDTPEMMRESESLKDCPYTEDCCMRFKGKCKALNNTHFKGKCHFRKTRPNGPNLYDKKDKDTEKKIYPVYCNDCVHRMELYTGDICEYTRLSVKTNDYCSLGERRGKQC